MVAAGQQKMRRARGADFFGEDHKKVRREVSKLFEKIEIIVLHKFTHSKYFEFLIDLHFVDLDKTENWGGTGPKWRERDGERSGNGERKRTILILILMHIK